MPTVPMTPTWPLRVADSMARTPGSITPTTGTSSDRASSSRSAAAAAVLHATTSSFTSCSSTSQRPIWWANARTSSSGRGPVGVPAGVADVDEVLGRQQVDEGPGHGEAAEPAVEHADRARIHDRTRYRRGALRSDNVDDGAQVGDAHQGGFVDDAVDRLAAGAPGGPHHPGQGAHHHRRGERRAAPQRPAVERVGIGAVRAASPFPLKSGRRSSAGRRRARRLAPTGRSW